VCGLKKGSSPKNHLKPSLPFLLAQPTTQAAGLFVFLFSLSPALHSPRPESLSGPIQHTISPTLPSLYPGHRQPGRTCQLLLLPPAACVPHGCTAIHPLGAACLLRCLLSPPPSTAFNAHWSTHAAASSTTPNGIHQRSTTIHGLPPPSTTIAGSSPPLYTL
jgi:hypothetical protein